MSVKRLFGFAAGLALLALVAQLFFSGCEGATVGDEGVCEAGTPSGFATAKVGNGVVFGPDGDFAVVDAGAEATVLLGARLSTPIGTRVDAGMGFPVNLVMHPHMPVAYVVDMDHDGYAVRCNPREGFAALRGIHVVNTATHQELQAPKDILLPPLPVLPDTDAGNPVGCNNVGDRGIDGGEAGLPYDSSYGIAISPDGKKLYATSGVSGYVYVFDVSPDNGTLVPDRAIYVGGYTAGITLSPDEKRLWIVRFLDPPPPMSTETAPTSSIIEVNRIDGGPGRMVRLRAQGAYAIADVSPNADGDGGDRLYVSGFRHGAVVVVDPDDPDAMVSVDAGSNPEAVLAWPEGHCVFVSVSNDDAVVRIPTDGGPLTSVALGEPEIPYPGMSPSGLALDKNAQLLYVARSADNAVSVVTVAPDASFAQIGSVPVGFYPTAVGITADGGQLVVANGKGNYVPPTVWQPSYCTVSQFNGQYMQGTLDVADMPLDLDAGTAAVVRDIMAPQAGDPPSCPGLFPVPWPGGESPIKHIFLIVRENKTFDFLLGGLHGDAGAENAIDAIRAGYPGCDAGQCAITTNIRDLAKQYAYSENFYANSEVSMQGHAWLTASFVNDYVERAYLEENGNSLANFDFDSESGLAPGEPGFGNFFTHLLKNQRSFTIYGEVVALFGHYGDDYVLTHIDTGYGFFDLTKTDTDRVEYLSTHLFDAGTPPDFVYISLPRDHTYGLAAGEPTPEAMIAENDEATGKIVEMASHSPFWNSTAIFIVEDDPQQGVDHVDYHRTICVMASPWARSDGRPSDVHTAFPSLFRTFELILGLPPMNRFDAYAMPLRDLFQGTLNPNSTYVAKASKVPISQTNSSCSTVDSFVSSKIDFGEPDQEPILGEVLWHRMTGQYLPGSRIEHLLETGHFSLPDESRPEPGEGSARGSEDVVEEK